MSANGSSWLSGRGGGAAVDVPALFAEPWASAGFAAIVEAGALLSMGTTSDGGALGITVTVNGEWRREYVRTSDELAAYLAEAVPAVQDILAVEGRQSAPQPLPAATAQRSRRRRSA